MRQTRTLKLVVVTWSARPLPGTPELEAESTAFMSGLTGALGAAGG